MYPYIETVRIENGKIENLVYHNRRLNATRRTVLGATNDLDLVEYINPILYLKRTKCRVEYKDTIISIDYTPYCMRSINTLKWVVCDEADYRYKSSNRSTLNRLFTQRKEADDILIIRNGLLTDTSICNVALWDGVSWITPDKPLLCGTMRAKLLDSGVIIPGDIHLDDLGNFSRLCLFNAMIDFGDMELPINAIL